ncbi:hypothetical protein BJX76DRAFT_346944 [Aspergillus varians]
MEGTSSPSPAQLALALAIVKLKPTGLDVKEYILQSRQSIKVPKSAAEVFHPPEKFFDSVSFWKQAYQKSEAEQSKLLDRIFELEQRNETLVAKLRPREEVPAEATIVQEPLKRKATRNQTTHKRAKTQLYTLGNLPSADIIEQLDSSRESTVPFMRQSYLLQRALQKRTNNASIAQVAVVLCKTCEHELVGAVPQDISMGKSKNGVLTPSQMSHLSLVLRGIESATSLLFQTLRKLSNHRDPGQEAKLLTYHVICLYDAIMKTLKRYCKTMPVYAAPTRAADPIRPEYTIQTRKRAAKQKNVSVETNTPSEAEDEGVMQLASLLNRMVKSLDLACLEHQRLLEGFLYILLSRAGEFLCLFVFQDLQLQPDLRIDPHKLSLPAALVDAKLDDKSLGAAEIEAKYIVWLLERALAVIDTCSKSLDSSPSENKSGKMQLISSIEARLQSTLVQAVFGADPEFGRPLERPAQPEGLDAESYIKSFPTPELSIPEWYLQEVWQLLGWEVLMKSNLS